MVELCNQIVAPTVKQKLLPACCSHVTQKSDEEYVKVLGEFYGPKELAE